MPWREFLIDSQFPGLSDTVIVMMAGANTSSCHLLLL